MPLILGQIFLISFEKIFIVKKLLITFLLIPFITFSQDCNSALFDLGDRLTLNYPLVSNQPAPIEFSATMTLEFWMKSTQMNGINDPRPFIFFKDSEDWSSMNHIYGRIQISLINGFLSASILAPNPQSFIPDPLISTNIVADGQWHHIAITRDNNDELKLYVDGIISDVEQGQSGTIGGGPNPFSIGWGRVLNNPSGGYFYEGNLDNFRIWNRDLSLNEVILYSEKCNVNDPDLLFNFDFDEITNNEFIDQTGVYSIDIIDISLDSVSPLCCDCEISSIDTTICIGDLATIYTESNYSLLWSNGDTSSTITVNAQADTTINLFFIDSNGSILCSDSINIYVDSASIPTIQQVGNNLISSNADGYQWYFNGVMLSGETSQMFSILGDGAYTVEITEANGCTAMSNIFEVVTSNINEFFLDKKILFKSDLFGRKIKKSNNNTIQIIYYDNGEVEKKIVLD